MAQEIAVFAGRIVVRRDDEASPEREDDRVSVAALEDALKREVALEYERLGGSVKVSVDLTRTDR